MQMFWSILAAGGAGCIIGLLLLRVQIVALISCSLVLVCMGIGLHGPGGVGAIVFTTVALVTALQAGYLAGGLASVAWMETKALHKIFRSSHNDQRRI